MTDTPEPDIESATAAPEIITQPRSATLWAFTATTFLSALLLFSIQPMFAKMVLPVLGGAPSVWAVAVCFFQVALLIGYCYAHVLIKALPLRQTGFVHLAVCATALVALPIALPLAWGEPPPGEPYLWQLGLFAVAVGLPFVAVAANAPLTQAWFAGTGDAHARDPYFLYAASNLGSLLALLSYPFVLEPAFGVRALSRMWTFGYVALVLALAGIFWLLRNSPAHSTIATQSDLASSDTMSAAHPTWSQRAAWTGLSLVPSALLTAFTTHVTTDVASAPLLWVLPLALYLLTFVLVFREHALVPKPVLLMVHLVAVVAALLVMSQTKHETWFLTAGVGVVVFFTSAMVAHRTLYEARPDARHLTEFYLWMSLGGALGGLAAALIAPKIFSEVFEYPLLLALSMACRPGALDFLRRDLDGKARQDDHLLTGVLIAFGLLVIYWVPWLLGKSTYTFGGWGATFIVTLLLALVMLANLRSPPRQVIAALAMVCAITWLPSGVKRGDAQRGYFGVYRVMQSIDGQFNILIHGSTLHGAQRIRDENGEAVADVSPATYYHDESPMARTIATRREVLAATGRKGRYGVIGLGTGSLACHSDADEDWRFFEIDPIVIGIARDSESFTFLSNCQPKPDIVIGDARLTMAKEADGSFDLIIVDAFSSDAVPVHLMTAEALALYVAKLAPEGIALLHISNRYLDLDAVLGATVKIVPGAHGIILSDDSSDGSYAQSTSTVALFARDPAVLERYKSLAELHELDPGRLRAWTDDYSDILGPFLSKIRRRFL
jgi:hypothetical protein